MTRFLPQCWMLLVITTLASGISMLPARAQSSNSVKIYRIALRDKGPETASLQPTDALPTNTPLYAQTRTLHSERALLRRRKVLTENRLLLVQDAPVYKPYLDSMAARGAQILLAVRWQNYVVIRTDSIRAIEIVKLPFVKFARFTSERVFPQTATNAAPGLHSSPSFVARPSVHNFLRREESAAFIPAVVATAVHNSIAATQAVMALTITPKQSNKFIYGPGLEQARSLNTLPAHALGITGKGVRMGFIDTGFRWKEHNSTRNARVLGEWDFVNADSVTANQAADSSKQDEHGTEVFSTVAGLERGVFAGVAPNAEFFLAKTENLRFERHIEEDYLAAALEWMEAQGVDVTNASLGYYNNFDLPDENYVYPDLDGKTPIASRAVNAAAERGVLHCNSAGNDGPNEKTINSPGDADGSLTVGATGLVNPLAPARFTSRGPRSDGKRKPDIAAQGDSVTVASVGTPSSYRLVSGTSFSSPIVSGGVALMLSAFPELSPPQIRSLITATGSQTDKPDGIIGFGTANVVNAMLRYGPIIAPELTYYPAYRSLRVVAALQSSSATVSATLYVRFAGRDEFTAFPMQTDGNPQNGAMFYADIDETLFRANNGGTNGNATGGEAWCYVVATSNNVANTVTRRMPYAGYPFDVARTGAPLLKITPHTSSIPHGIALEALPFTFPRTNTDAQFTEGVFPSPIARGETASFMMFTPQAGTLQFTVYSMTGQQMLDQTLTATTGLTTTQLPVRTFSQGMYVARVLYNGELRSYKFLVTGN